MGQAPEASGLVASRRNPGLLYIVDDGPGTTSLLVIDQRARVVTRLGVEGLEGTDTEDLAVVRCPPGQGRWCVVIGDIGDNVLGRDSISLTWFAEPALDAGAAEVAVAAQQTVLRYPDGAHDAEALLADRHGTIGIVTKAAGRRGDGAARLYLLASLDAGSLERGGRIDLPAPATPAASLLTGVVVTGGDAVPGRVVLRTYDALYELSGTGRLADIPDWEVRQIPSPAEPQGEAVAYARDGCGLFTVSEDSGRLTSIPCR